VEHVDGEGVVERHNLDARGHGTATAIVDATPHGEVAMEEHGAGLVDHDVLVAADVAGVRGDLDRALVDAGLPAERQLPLLPRVALLERRVVVGRHLQRRQRLQLPVPLLLSAADDSAEAEQREDEEAA